MSHAKAWPFLSVTLRKATACFSPENRRALCYLRRILIQSKSQRRTAPVGSEILCRVTNKKSPSLTIVHLSLFSVFDVTNNQGCRKPYPHPPHPRIQMDT